MSLTDPRTGWIRWPFWPALWPLHRSFRSCSKSASTTSAICPRSERASPSTPPRTCRSRKQCLLVRRRWQRRRSHLSQVVHRIVRNIRHAHLLENELLKVIVRFLSPHAVGVANHRGDGVDDGLRDGASDFCWKPPAAPCRRRSSHRGCGKSSNRARLDDRGGRGRMQSRSRCGRYSQIEGFAGIRRQGVVEFKAVKACRHFAEVLRL